MIHAGMRNSSRPAITSNRNTKDRLDERIKNWAQKESFDFINGSSPAAKANRVSASIPEWLTASSVLGGPQGHEFHSCPSRKHPQNFSRSKCRDSSRAHKVAPASRRQRAF